MGEEHASIGIIEHHAVFLPLFIAFSILYKEGD